MKSTSSLNELELEIELELKHLVATSNHAEAIADALSSHRIDQCYFHSALAVFEVGDNVLGISLANIELNFDANKKQQRTLAAILEQTPDPTIRLRRMDSDWYFTVKGLSMDEGTLEFEVSLSDEQGAALVEHAYQSLEKMRHMVEENGYLWEVDVYLGKLAGLIVAELEDRKYDIFPPNTLPAWIGLDVTNDFRYKNSCLAALQEGELDALLTENSPQP